MVGHRSSHKYLKPKNKVTFRVSASFAMLDRTSGQIDAKEIVIENPELEEQNRKKLSDTEKVPERAELGRIVVIDGKSPKDSLLISRPTMTRSDTSDTEEEDYRRDYDLEPQPLFGPDTGQPYKFDDKYDASSGIWRHAHGRQPLPRNARILRTHWLKKGKKVVNIIIVPDDNAATAIFHFHSTIVMNYFSGYGVFCAYPALTLARKGILNSSVAQSDAQRRRVARCIDKYTLRGFDMKTNLNEHKNWEQHTCAVYDGRTSVVWSLGGDACTAKNVYHKLFSVSTPIFVKEKKPITFDPDIIRGLAPRRLQVDEYTMIPSSEAGEEETESES
ncbi:hypothetical protein R3P38DRAFT_2796267 [Favolaschia claudopus]|uniref:Uncharacterized protein n=1 Tax=Favolaschia claudopus TaxID=2862362 RepID=A0AAW0A5R1_9AGAR